MSFFDKSMLRRDDRRGAAFRVPNQRRRQVGCATHIADPDDLSLGRAQSRDPRIPRWKRLLDLSGTLVCAACLAPIVVMIAMLIKLGSQGPILFRQERIGLSGKPFTIFKFRTMAVGADTCVHEQYTADLIATDKPMTKLDTRGDARLIPFGRLLRAAGLDELPQLINVWRGEMSLVGPRPCLPTEAKRYKLSQRERFLTPPGLTGLWQVSGKNRTTFNEMVQLDVDYVRNRSLLLDLTIILKTIPAIMREVRDIRGPAPAIGEELRGRQEEA